MLTHLKNKLRNQTIGKKFTAPVVAVMIGLIAVILIISSIVLYWSAIRKTEKEVRTSCEMIAMQLEDVSDNAKTCLKTITKDINRIYSGENVFGMTDIESLQTMNEINTAMDYSRLCFPDITALIYADNSGKVALSGKRMDVDMPSFEELKPLIAQIPEKGLANVKELGVNEFSFLKNKGPAWILGHRVISMNTGKNIGYAFAVVTSETLSQYFPETNDTGYYSDYQLWDEEGKVIASRDRNTLLKTGGSAKFLQKFKQDAGFRIREDNTSYLVTTCNVWHEGWSLVNRVEIYELTREIRMLVGFILAAGMFCILISVFVIRKIAAWITQPIQELTETVKQFRNDNLDIRCRLDSTDEIGILAGVFNEMLERIECQMENIREGQRQKREYELALIQAQIKPHFLYNTLDLIYIFCQMGNSKGGAAVTKALADFHRVSLSKGREIITIAEEVKNISSYLLIQKERYSDLVDFSIEVDQDIYLCEIPKMTLQPLVENAIYHGLKARRQKGNIRVLGKQENDLLYLTVEDNGAGMPKELWQSILKGEENVSSTHFGLLSVHRRIQLYYGEEYGLEIESSIGEGTSVMIRIPRKGGNHVETADRR